MAFDWWIVSTVQDTVSMFNASYGLTNFMKLEYELVNKEKLPFLKVTFYDKGLPNVREFNTEIASLLLSFMRRMLYP